MKTALDQPIVKLSIEITGLSRLTHLLVMTPSVFERMTVSPFVSILGDRFLFYTICSAVKENLSNSQISTPSGIKWPCSRGYRAIRTSRSIWNEDASSNDNMLGIFSSGRVLARLRRRCAVSFAESRVTFGQREAFRCAKLATMALGLLRPASFAVESLQRIEFRLLISCEQWPNLIVELRDQSAFGLACLLPSCIQLRLNRIGQRLDLGFL